MNYLEAVWRDPGFVKLGVTERERSRSEADELGTPKWEAEMALGRSSLMAMAQTSGAPNKLLGH